MTQLVMSFEDLVRAVDSVAERHLTVDILIRFSLRQRILDVSKHSREEFRFSD